MVEDNTDDVELTARTFATFKVNAKLSVVATGEDALDFLFKRDRFKDATEPDLILLDLNLPGLHGREVLEIVKSDERLKHIPVAILTSSSAEEDIVKSYKLSANCYITKPVDFEQFIKVVRVIEDFWLTVVKLPTKYPD